MEEIFESQGPAPPQITPAPLGEHPGGWFLISPEALPESWRERAVPVYMIRLDSADVEKLSLQAVDTYERLETEEIEIARLLAQGLPPREIALTLHLSRRSVFRRLARLRQLFDANSNGELATKLAKQNL
jgi:DNA-binding CsgD family transcriptional regulator